MNIDLKIKETNDKLLDVIKESNLPISVLSFIVQDILTVLNVQKQMVIQALEKQSEVKKDGI